MKKKILFISLAVVLALSVGLIGCTQESQQEEEEEEPEEKYLEVGCIFALTGLGSEVGILLRQGAELCRDWLNEDGGITVDGEKYLIDLTVEDSKGTTDGAVAAAVKLVEQDQVDFIVGLVIPDECFAVESVTEPAEVLLSICWGGGVPGVISPETPYTFRPVLSGAEVIPVVYDYLVETYPGVEKVAVIAEDDVGNQFFAAVSGEIAAAHGLEMVAVEFVPEGTQDFTPALTAALAAEPDALDFAGAYPIPVSLKLKQARELGFTGPCFQPSPVELYTIQEIAGEDFAYDFFNGSMDIDDPDVPPMMQELETLWEAEYGTRFMFESFQGWDALWCMAQAIEAADSFDTTVVATTWENMPSIETCYGTGEMGGLQTYGINHLVVRPCPITEFVNGDVSLIKWYTPSFP